MIAVIKAEHTFFHIIAHFSILFRSVVGFFCLRIQKSSFSCTFSLFWCKRDAKTERNVFAFALKCCHANATLLTLHIDVYVYEYGIEGT